MVERRSTALPVRHAVPHQLVENRKRSCRLLSFSTGINSKPLCPPRRHWPRPPRLYTEAGSLLAVSGENIIVGGAPTLSCLIRPELVASPASADRGNVNARETPSNREFCVIYLELYTNLVAFHFPPRIFSPCLPFDLSDF